MKITKKNLTLGITIALISVLSISIGATVIRNNKHTRFYVRPAEKTKSVQTPVIYYKGELIPFIQLREVVISDKAIQKKK